MMRNNKQLEEQQQHQHHQEELYRLQELQKQLNNLNGLPQHTQQHLQQQQQQQQHNLYNNGMDHKSNVDFMAIGLSEYNRLTQQAALLQKQQQQQQRLHNNMHSVQENGHIYPGNMSKFFDFHKNQQNQVFIYIFKSS